MPDKIVTVNIKGLDELQRALEEVPREVSKSVLRKSLTAAAKLMRLAIVDAAPHETGFLAEHFNIRFKSYKKDVAASSFIGPDGKMTYPKKLSMGPQREFARHRTIKVVSVARFLMFGTSKMSANPFMTRGFEGAKDKCLAIIVAGIKDALASAARAVKKI